MKRVIFLSPGKLAACIFLEPVNAMPKAQFEAIPQTAQGSFVVREFHLERFPIGWHFHPEVELTAIIGSSGRRWVGDHVTGYEAGDLVLIGPNLPHYWMNDAGAAGMAHSVVVQFRMDAFGPGFFDLTEMKAVKELLSRSKRGIRFTGSGRTRVAERLLALRDASGLSSFLGLLGVLGDLAEEREYELLSSPDFTPKLDGTSVERVDKIYDYIARHSAHDFSHAELASLLGTSSSGLSHYFKRTVGCTLSSFVAEVRIGQACRQLILTDRPVSEIAFSSGFESLSTFNDWFRKLRGLSPRDFRQSHRKEESNLKPASGKPSRAARRSR